MLDLTDGQGVDHVVDVVGGSNIDRSISALASNGVISQIGVIDGLKGEIEISKLMPKEAIIQGIQVGSREMFLHIIRRSPLIKYIRSYISYIHPPPSSRH